MIKLYTLHRRRNVSSALMGALFLIMISAFALTLLPKVAKAQQTSTRQNLSNLSWSTPIVKSTTSQATNVVDGTMGPLAVSMQNGRYFQRPNGKAIILTGSHTWQNFQDSGWGTPAIPPNAFNYTAYLDFLQQRNHNFFRLWTWEQTRWTNEASQDDYWFNPQTPYIRTANGMALDGLGRFDLNQFNQAYFDRMRERIIEAGERGMYVSVMLFDGWSIQNCKGGNCQNNPWKGHPYNNANNINGVNGDLNNDNSGEEIQTLASTQITTLQEAYVKKLIDTIGDLDNVLYEISNEGPSNSQNWQYHMINYIKGYEFWRPKQHPVGMTVEWPNGNNAELYSSPADWISPNGDLNNPPIASGAKVVVADTDHLCGICGDSNWAWKSFMRGENPIFMDGYDSAAYGVGGGGFVMNDPKWVSLRASLGHIRNYSERVDLAGMTPSVAISSTGYALAKTSGLTDDEYLVYASNGGVFTVDLTGTSSAALSAEWFNTETGQIITQLITNSNGLTTFKAPFTGPAILYLKQVTDDTIEPTVQITQPADGATTAGVITLEANASDNQAVANVTFTIDGLPIGLPVAQSPYQTTFNTASVVSGPHVIRATATDTSGNTAYHEITIMISNNGDTSAPTVTITAPTNNAIVSGTIAISADAMDDTGVVGVKFLVDGVLISEDTSSPYTVDWSTGVVSGGKHQLTAVARDAVGNTAISQIINVTTNNPVNSMGLLVAYGFNNPLSPMFDASGKGNHVGCTPGNCPTYSSSGGHTGGVYNFSGSNNYLIVPNEAQFDFTKNFTVSTWMKVNGFTAPWETLITKGDSAWGLERYASSNNPDFATFSPAAHDLTGNANIANNVWHHVTATYDGVRKKLYVDGNLIANVAYNKVLSTNNLPVLLGFNQEFSPADYGGLLDDVRIYNRALTQSEVQADKNNAVN